MSEFLDSTKDSRKFLKNDQRADPEMVKNFTAMNMDSPSPVLPVSRKSSAEDQLSFMMFNDQLISSTVHELNDEDLDVTTDETSISGVDGNKIDLMIHKPKNVSSSTPLPCVINIHGGGMCVCSMRNGNFIYWRSQLSALQMIVVGVEYRNAAGLLGNHPFPSGLNDCVSAVKWVNANKTELNISKIILNGDSGGANLSIATSLKLKQEGLIHLIDGVYAMCPFISGLYDVEDEETALLPSLESNNGLFFDTKFLGIFAHLYDPNGLNSKNLLAWPYWAEIGDLMGLPPFVVSLNELDLLVDEGLAFYRKLLKAGVKARCRTVHGTTHAVELVLMDKLPEIFHSTLRDIKTFVYHL